ncbi:g6442 [Coccomyxa viridis]|uniref:G6442 protein n=1 Tax=Coccomyxa viridis TaxID=1274662 RepID=A0ABP1FWN1_9CHLO
MAQFRTDQERIDAATLEIKNPNVVGSGYIQHPPQKPFAAPLQMQPPTVAHFEFPDEYSKYRAHTRQNGGQGPPRRAQDQRSQGYGQANGRPQNGTAPYSSSNGQQSSYRQPHGTSGRGPQHTGAGSRPAQGAPRPGRGPNGTAEPQTQARPAAVAVVPQRASHQGAPQQQRHANNTAHSAPQVAPHRQSAPPQQAPHAPVAPASQSGPSANGQSTAALSQPVGQMAPTDVGPRGATEHTQPTANDTDEHDKSISKSQAKRLRKKRREGKV